jgi:peptide/nickel transport system permease protein
LTISANPADGPVAPQLPRTVAGRNDRAAMSQWLLIGRRFARHRLAVASMYVLAVLYSVAALAEFIAPYRPNVRNIDRAYAPPQRLRFNFADGLHTFGMRGEIDPITFRRSYVELRDAPVPVRFLTSGDSYRFWGVIPANRHLFGAAHLNSDGTPARFLLLGADKYGRDIFTRIVYGARVSLSVGLIGVFFTFLLGTMIGGISGYTGGRVDTLIQRTIEIINAFPQLPLWLALAAVLPGDWSPIRTYFAITILLSLLNWTGLARVVRGKILSLREEDYAVAARLLGASHSRILFRHLMPGFTSHIIVALTLAIPGMILGETSLSFLGLGLRPPVVSWGVMLQDCMDVKAVSLYPWLLSPVVFIVITVLCFNFLGDGLRDAADPYSSR